MERVYNFSPGPSMLPLAVLEKAQKELLNFEGSGMSVMEMSHRSKVYEQIVAKAEASLRELMEIPENYKVLFLQGGATMQFAQVPLNLLNGSGVADYIDSGVFAAKAIKEAKKYGKINVVASSKDAGYRKVPAWDKGSFTPDADYFHITTNNTVYGTHYTSLPDTGKVPLVGDMSSNILAEVYDVSKFGLIYAGAQKNIGMAGVTVVIVREDLLGKARAGTPDMLDYKLMADAGSLFNTPTTYGIYVAGLVFEHLKSIGGVPAMEKINREKSALVYDLLDDSDFYTAYADPEHRSLMNLTFATPSAELDDAFVKGAAARGLLNLKGYRSVGGIRASMYNAMPVEGVAALVAFMKDFAAANG